MGVAYYAMANVEYGPGIEEAEMSLVFTAQDLLVRKGFADGSVTMLTYADGNWGEVSFLNGNFHTLKVDVDFTRWGGELIQKYLGFQADDTLNQTNVVHPSFTNRANGSVTSGLPSTYDLEIFTNHLKNPAVLGIGEFRPAKPPLPELKSTRRQFLSRFVGRVPVRKLS